MGKGAGQSKVCMSLQEVFERGRYLWMERKEHTVELWHVKRCRLEKRAGIVDIPAVNSPAAAGGTGCQHALLRSHTLPPHVRSAVEGWGWSVGLGGFRCTEGDCWLSGHGSAEQ